MCHLLIIKSLVYNLCNPAAHHDAWMVKFFFYIFLVFSSGLFHPPASSVVSIKRFLQRHVMKDDNPNLNLPMCVCFQVSLVDEGYLSRCASLQWPGLPLRLGQLQLGNLHGPWSLPARSVENCLELRPHQTRVLWWSRDLCSCHSATLHFQLFLCHTSGDDHRAPWFISPPFACF